ncbi:hypothetical protein PTKIN_Ptkin01aG0390600 [Pterospermum kingtungense]
MALSTLDLLFGKIVFTLENEASLLSGVRDEIKEIERELNSMRSFLEGAERSAGHYSQAKENWVANVRDIACEIEDGHSLSTESNLEAQNCFQAAKNQQRTYKHAE